ncbi:hypothetical protein MRX96_018695 [Rhipicephalus microplus]
MMTRNKDTSNLSHPSPIPVSQRRQPRCLFVEEAWAILAEIAGTAKFTCAVESVTALAVAGGFLSRVSIVLTARSKEECTLITALVFMETIIAEEVSASDIHGGDGKLK